GTPASALTGFSLPSAKSENALVACSWNRRSTSWRFLRTSRMPSKYSVWIALLPARSARSNSASSTFSNSVPTSALMRFSATLRTSLSRSPRRSPPLPAGCRCCRSTTFGVSLAAVMQSFRWAVARGARAPGTGLHHKSGPRAECARVHTCRARTGTSRAREPGDRRGRDRLVGQHDRDSIVDAVDGAAIARDQGLAEHARAGPPARILHLAGLDRLVHGVAFGRGEHPQR